MAAAANVHNAQTEGVPEPFRHDFVEDVNEMYKCPVCLNLIDNPAHVPECGHVFCRTCIDNWLSSSPTSCCPVDNLEIDRTKIHIDNRIRREIGNLKVWCKNKELGCQTSTELNYLQDHVEKCEYKPELCPLECGETIPSLWVDKHKKEKCLRRMLSCDVCGGGMQAQEMMVHAAICPMAEVECEHCDTAPMTRKQFIEEHEPTCEKTPTSCMFAAHGCVDKIIRGSLTKHCEEASLIHLNLLSEDLELNKDDVKSWKSQQKVIVETQEKRDGDKQDRITALENENQEMREMISTLRDNAKEMNANFSELKEEMTLKIANLITESKEKEDKYTKENTLLKNKIEGLLSLHSTSGADGSGINICPYSWRVDLYDCRNGKCSPTFYSNVSGYKFYVKVIGYYENSTGCIYLYLNKGENDDNLNWPFTGDVRLTVTHVKSDTVLLDSYASKELKYRTKPDTETCLMCPCISCSPHIQQGHGNCLLDFTVKVYL